MGIDKTFLFLGHLFPDFSEEGGQAFSWSVVVIFGLCVLAVSG